MYGNYNKLFTTENTSRVLKIAQVQNNKGIEIRVMVNFSSTNTMRRYLTFLYFRKEPWLELKKYLHSS